MLHNLIVSYFFSLDLFAFELYANCEMNFTNVIDVIDVQTG